MDEELQPGSPLEGNLKTSVVTDESLSNMLRCDVLRMNRAYLIVLFLFLSTSLCVTDEDFMIQSDEEENLAIYLSSDEPRELFDPFDLLNYDRQKMLEHKKKKAVRGLVDSNFDPFDPLNQNQKRYLKGKTHIGKEVYQTIKENDDKPQDVVDELSVLTNQNFLTNEKMSEDEVSEKKSEQETINCNIEEKCKCETELQMCDDPIEARERPILRRFVQSLYSTLSLENVHITDGDVLHFTLSAKISQRAHGILHDIVSTDGDIKKKKLADLDEILFDLFKLETSQPNKGLSASLLEIINFHPKDWILFLFTSSICIFLAILIQRRSIFAVCASFGILLICVSWYWSWHKLYQQSLSKRASDAIKYSEMPASCKPAQLSSFAAAAVWFLNKLKGEDPCQKYHEILMTDPVYQVTPIMALSDTLATAIFHPLGYIGRQFGQFFNGVLEESSWYSKIPVFVCVVFLLVVSLCLVCGYEIHLPFMMGSLKPARHKKTRSLDSINSPQVETITSISEQQSHGTPPQPIMVVVNVVTDAMGDSKVQKIIERAIEPASLPSLISEQALSESTMKTVPSPEFSNNDTKNIASDDIDEPSENSTELEFDDAAEIADKNDASSSRKQD